MNVCMLHTALSIQITVCVYLTNLLNCIRIWCVCVCSALCVYFYGISTNSQYQLCLFFFVFFQRCKYNAIKLCCRFGFFKYLSAFNRISLNSYQLTFIWAQSPTANSTAQFSTHTLSEIIHLNNLAWKLDLFFEYYYEISGETLLQQPTDVIFYLKSKYYFISFKRKIYISYAFQVAWLNATFFFSLF